MSVNKKTPEQLETLKATLKLSPHIKKVYFDKNGNHFFTAHKYRGAIYSRIPQQRVISGFRGNVAIVKIIDKLNSKDKLIETLTREQVLAYTIV